jgi:murein DD-endopeptidase MepM/ murein hydrolase activator NlpD
MSLSRKSNACPRRLGRWAATVFAAALLSQFLIVLPLFASTEGAGPTTTTGPSLRQQLAQKQAALGQATAELEALQQELNQLAEQHNAMEVRLAELEQEIVQTTEDIVQSERDLAEVRVRLEERLVGIYKQESSSPPAYVQVLLNEDDLASVLMGFDTLASMADQDRKLFDEVRTYQEATTANKELLEQKQAEQIADLEELGRLEDEASAKLAAVNTRYQALKSQVAKLKEEIRKADAAAAAAAAAARAKAIADKAYKEGKAWNNSSNGTMHPPPFVFPVKGAHAFSDTWGAWRSGGRSHRGCDVMAANGTPLLACVNGTISGARYVESGLGGITVHLRGDNGYIYYYAHLDRIAAGVKVGLVVKAGTTIGYVGHTGNAGRCNHLHFGIQPGGRVSVNPYATLRFYDD